MTRYKNISPCVRHEHRGFLASYEGFVYRFAPLLPLAPPNWAVDSRLVSKEN